MSSKPSNSNRPNRQQLRFDKRFLAPTFIAVLALAYGLAPVQGSIKSPLGSTFAPNKYAKTATFQEKEDPTKLQDETDETAPPPRNGRKKFTPTPKRGKVVPADPNAPIAPAPPVAPAAPKLGLAGQASPGNRSVSRQVINGDSTTILQTDDQKIVVEENSQGVFVNQERIYRRSDLPELEEKNPKLAEAIKGIPDQADGAFLDVEIKATQKFEALTVEALEKDQPEAYKMYQMVMAAYQEQGDMGLADGFPMQGFGGVLGPGFEIDQMQQQMQNEMKEIRKQMQQQMKQFQRNGGGNFQFRFGN